MGAPDLGESPWHQPADQQWGEPCLLKQHPLTGQTPSDSCSTESHSPAQHPLTQAGKMQGDLGPLEAAVPACKKAFKGKLSFKWCLQMGCKELHPWYNDITFVWHYHVKDILPTPGMPSQIPPTGEKRGGNPMSGACEASLTHSSLVVSLSPCSLQYILW